jgi:SAM-dependent methyltransferase
MAEAQTYVGDELELFAPATNWKRYYGRRVLPLLGPRVLEVGAGIGATTRHLCGRGHEHWLCLEPDASFCARIGREIAAGTLPAFVAVRPGTIADLQADGPSFDTILYVDVLEHIADDRGELEAARRLLRPGGAVVVLAPAHHFLFSPFDQHIGHFRRYDARAIRAACPPGLGIERLEYLDSVGMLASLANRCLLSQTTPGLRQIEVWDRLMVPVSRVLDPLLAHRLGKSILAVLRAGATTGAPG